MTRALRRHGIDVLTAQEDQRAGRPDVDVLPRAVELGRILVTRDRDFFKIHRDHLVAGRSHHGILVYSADRDRHSAVLATLLVLVGASELSEHRDQIRTIPF
jgi:predicted nuclease of predicted toxin-antitoxin system